MTNEQLNEIRSAYEAEDPKLGELLKNAGFNESELNSLRDYYESNDDAGFGNLVKSKLDDLSPQVENRVNAPKMMVMDKPSQTKPEESLGDIGISAAQALFPRLAEKGQDVFESENALDFGKRLGTNTLLGSLDAATALGGAAGDLLGLGSMGTRQHWNEQGLPDENGEGGDGFIRGMAKGALADPLLLAGAPAYRLGSKAIGGAISNPFTKKLMSGALSGVGLGSASNVLRASAEEEEFTPLQSGLAGGVGGVGGELLGSGVGAIAKKLSGMYRPTGATQELAPINTMADPIQNKVENIESSMQSTGLSQEQLNEIPKKYLGVMTSLTEPEKETFKEMQNQAIGASYARNQAPLEVDGELQFRTLKDKLKEYGQSAGREMGDIEELGLQGQIEKAPILEKLKQHLADDYLELKNIDGKYKVIESSENGVYNPDEHPEIQKIVDLFFNKSDAPTMSGQAFRNAQRQAIATMKKNTPTDQVSPMKRTLLKFDDDIDNGIYEQLNSVNPELGSKYSRAKQKYAQFKKAEGFLGKRLGDQQKWTSDDGSIIEGMQTGGSFYQSLTNSGSAKRGSEFLNDLAQREFGMPNLKKRAMMARYSEELAGIRGPRESSNKIPMSIPDAIVKGKEAIVKPFQSTESKITNAEKIGSKLIQPIKQKNAAQKLATKVIEKSEPRLKVILAPASALGTQSEWKRLQSLPKRDFK